MKKLYTINTNEAEVFMEVIYNPFLVSFKAENPDIDVKNIIDDSLLNDTRLYGGMTTAIANRMLSYAKAAEYSGADGVLVTCTSVNKATKMIRPLLSIPILNIEEPVAEMAVSAGTRIGVLATIPTSPKAIIEVIQEKAAAAGKNVTIVTRVADGAFDVLKSGDRERHDEAVVVHGVVVEIAVVVVEGLAVVRGEYDDGIVRDAQIFELVEDDADGRVHVCDRAVILCADVFGVGAFRREPRAEIVAERQEIVYGIEGVVVGIVFVAGVEHSFKRFRREIGRVRVHVAQEEHEGLIFRGQSLQLRNGDAV